MAEENGACLRVKNRNLLLVVDWFTSSVLNLALLLLVLVTVNRRLLVTCHHGDLLTWSYMTSSEAWGKYGLKKGSAARGCLWLMAAPVVP